MESEGIRYLLDALNCSSLIFLHFVDVFGAQPMIMVLGQKGTANPSAMMASLLSKRAKLQEELRNIEKQVRALFLLFRCYLQ